MAGNRGVAGTGCAHGLNVWDPDLECWIGMTAVLSPFKACSRAPFICPRQRKGRSLEGAEPVFIAVPHDSSSQCHQGKKEEEEEDRK